MLWAVAQVGCVPILPPRQSHEKVVETRCSGERIEESIVQKTFKVQWFAPVNPDADPFPYTQYDQYYLREKRDYELTAVHAGIDKLIASHKPQDAYTQETFIPVGKSPLWICLVQEIVSADIVNTLVIVLDKNKKRNEFFVKNCLRNKGTFQGYAVDWERDRGMLRIHTQTGTINYAVESDTRVK